jgi:hypothetical protein
MNTKNTWGLVATAVALFAFIYLFERGSLNSGNGTVTQHRLLNRLQPALVSRIEVQVGTNATTLERTNNTWRLIAPVAYPAYQAQAKNFLDGCAELAWTTKIPATELAKSPRGLADYGLEPPRSRFVLVQNNERIEVKIGDETPVGGQRYVQLGEEIVAYLVDAKISALLPKSSAAWRDRGLLPAGLAFNRVEIHAGNRVTEFQRDETNQVWRITKPITARADNIRIKDLIQQWRVWEVEGFLGDNPPATDLERLGFKPPELELILGQGTNNVFAVQFGAVIAEKPELLFALRSSHTNVVVTSQPWVEPLRSLFSEFRDRRLLTFPTNTTDYIEVRSEESFTLQRQTNGAWTVPGQTNFVVDTQLVNEMLLNLNNLDVVAWDMTVDNVTDWTPYGLAPSLQRYALYSGGTNLPPAGTNSLVAELELGNAKEGRIFARRPDESSAYALSQLTARKLPRALFQLRDRRVWSFSTNDVKRIAIENEGRKHELVRNAKGVWALGEGFNGIVNLLAVEETVYRLGELRALKWVDRGPAIAQLYGITPESHGITLTLQRNGGPEEKLMLRIGTATPARNAVYAAVVMDGKTVVFELPQALYDYIARHLNAPRPPGSN